MLEFSPSTTYTLGVEIEFQTLDKEFWDLAPFAPTLLENAPEQLRARLSPEFIQSILEMQTGICKDLRAVESDLMATISMAEELAEEFGCHLFSASLHPFASYRQQILTTAKRYEKIMDELQLLGRRFICQGFHVHVGVPDGDTAVTVLNKIQAYLPLLLALSASSPFSRGEDTGLVSYRTKLFDALPLAGRYSYFADWNHLAKEVEMLQEREVIGSLKDLWWDTRPSPAYGTIEIRVCDLPIRFNDILGITALIQSLVATLAEEGIPAAPLNDSIIRANKWQAVRHGLEGKFVDPTGRFGPGKMETRAALEELFKWIRPKAMSLGGEGYLLHAERILEIGTGADYMRARYAATEDFKSVTCCLYNEFWG